MKMQVTKLVIRNIYGGQTKPELGLYNAEETIEWVNEMYLSQGYVIANSGYMSSPNPELQGGLGSHMFFWSLVKEVDNQKPAKEAKKATE
jgi:hypothetical protein